MFLFFELLFCFAFISRFDYVFMICVVLIINLFRFFKIALKRAGRGRDLERAGTVSGRVLD